MFRAMSRFLCLSARYLDCSDIISFSFDKKIRNKSKLLEIVEGTFVVYCTRRPLRGRQPAET